MLLLNSRTSGKLLLTTLSVSLAFASCGWVTPKKSTKDAPADKQQTPTANQSDGETQTHKSPTGESPTPESPTPTKEQANSQPPTASTPTPAPTPILSPSPVQTAETTQFDGTVVKWFRNTKYPQLGEAWLTPDGRIWGDIAKDSDGRPLKLTYAKARAYCDTMVGMDARLPYLKEFKRLAKYMGAKGDIATNWREETDGYKPQVLPNLTYPTGDGKVRGYTFWGQPIDDYDSVEFAYYASAIGITSSASLTAIETRNVRCIQNDY